MTNMKDNTEAEKILKAAINKYCNGVYSKSSMGAVEYNIAIVAIKQTLKEAREKLKGILQSIKASVDFEDTHIVYANIDEIAKENDIEL